MRTGRSHAPDAVPHVLVLGAGMAGLGAARALVEGGARVTVIEARDRIGGRTHTSRLWPDLPLDMGASWVHGVTGNPLIALADRTGAAWTRTSYARALSLDAMGRRIDFEGAARRAEVLVDAARRRVADLPADVSLATAVTGDPAWIAIDPQERRLQRMAINTRIEHEYSGDWTRLSAWWFGDGDDFPGGDAVFNQGYGTLVDHLAQGLEIRLGEVVQAILPASQGTRIVTDRGEHRANHAVVTLPLGVLKSGDVQFGQPLHRARQRAIDGLEMGLLNKCWLRFDRVFWPVDVDWIDHLGPEAGLWADWASALPGTGQPVLVGFNAAAMAEEVETWDDRSTTASAMAALRAMFGTAVPDPVGSQISRWRQDRFSRGSYSFVATGMQGQDRRALFGADWEGRLQFAGEATSHDHAATAHGALMTGRAVAAAILRGA